MIVVDEYMVGQRGFSAAAVLAHGEPLLLLGKRVAAAFGLDYMPYSVACGAVLMAVLPSGIDVERTGRCLVELLELARAARAVVA